MTQSTFQRVMQTAVGHAAWLEKYIKTETLKKIGAKNPGLDTFSISITLFSEKVFIVNAEYTE